MFADSSQELKKFMIVRFAIVEIKNNGKVLILSTMQHLLTKPMVSRCMLGIYRQPAYFQKCVYHEFLAFFAGMVFRIMSYFNYDQINLAVLCI